MIEFSDRIPRASLSHMPRLHSCLISLAGDNAPLSGLRITLPRLMCVECIIYYLLFYVIRLMHLGMAFLALCCQMGVMTFCGSGFCALALGLNSARVQTSHPNGCI